MESLMFLTGIITGSARFIKKGGMLSALIAKNWSEFACKYNGPGYKQDKYDEKLLSAYNSFKGK